MKRTVWLVKTKRGYVSTKRFNYAEGTHHDYVPFESARIFTRKADTKNYPGEAVEATLTVQDT